MAALLLTVAGLSACSQSNKKESKQMKVYAFDENTRIHFLLCMEEEWKQHKQDKAFFAHWPSPSFVGTGR